MRCDIVQAFGKLDRRAVGNLFTGLVDVLLQV